MSNIKPSRYLIPATAHTVREEIKRSRFITNVGYAPTLDDARAFVQKIRRKHSNASHNCWAYVVGKPGNTGQVGLSDDGEPHGTAGRPMLTVLLHSGVGDICAVVTRYFGGTLLGKGGLVKAYSGGVKLAVESLPTIERVPKAELLAVVDYSSVTPVQRMLPNYEAEVLDEEYGVDVTYHVKLPLEQVQLLTDALIDLTNGKAEVEIIAQDEELPL